MNGERNMVLRVLSLAVSHAGLAVLAGFVGYTMGKVAGGKKEVVEAEATLARGAVAVTTAPASRTVLERALRLTGTIAAGKKVTVVPELPGKIVELKVDEGDAVERGKTVLAVIEHDDLVAQENAGAAGIDVARAQLSQLAVGLEQARRDLERARSLHAEGSASKQVLEKARAGVDSLVAQKNVLEAQIRQLQASLELVRLRLKDATVVSPASGVVTNLYDLDVGDTVVPGMPFCEVSELDEVRVLLIATEDELAPLKGGEKVRVEVPALERRVFEGKVDKLPQTLNLMTRTGTVEVGVGNREGLLRPGLFVSAAVVVEKKEGALVVPESAVVLRSGRPVAYVVLDGRAEEKPVMLGLRASGRVQVTEGLNEGDEVVSGGAKMLRDGTMVKVVKR